MSEIAFFPGSTAFALVLAMSLALAGCLPSTAEGPDRLITVSDETSAIRQMLAGPPDLSNTTEDYRNHYITARMYAIDLAYYQYEASLTREHQDTNFAADVINIGLTSSIPLVSSTATKDILGAAASGLTGVKNSYNEDVLLTKTIQILQSQMRSNRARLFTQISTNLHKSITDYPFTVALSNLEDYYRAGTISGALLSVETNVAIDKDTNEQAKSEFETFTLARDATSTTLRAMLVHNGVYDIVEAQKVRSLLNSYGSKIRLPDVISRPENKDLRARLIRDLNGR